MFIECPRHKSKMQRNVLYCIERCSPKCDQFFALDPEEVAAILNEHPDRGGGHQMELFPLAGQERRRRKG